MRKALLVVLILSSAIAWAQGGCTGQKPLNGVTTGGYLKALANQPIRVCTDTLNPCTAATIYSDAALQNQIPNPVTTDAGGNYQYCAAVGVYNEQITSASGLFSQVNNTPVSIGGGSGVGAQVISTNRLGHYGFADGSGSTLKDDSGNHNDGTLAASTAAPTWVSGGGLASDYTVSPTVSLPSALNTARTIQIAFFNPTCFAAMQNVPILLGSTVATGLHINLRNQNGGTCNGIPSLYTAGPSTYRTQSKGENTIGMHVLTVTMDGVADRIYIDGNEVTYLSQTNSYGLATGNWQLFGTAAVGSTAFVSVTVHDLAFYSVALTPAQVLTNYYAIRDYLRYVRGVTFDPPTPLHIEGNRILAVGSSITQGKSPATPWPSLLVTDDTYTVTNNGQSGGFTRDNWANFLWRDNPLLPKNGAKGVLLFEGALTNECNAGITYTAAWNYYLAYARQARAAGWKTIAVTMLSRLNNDTCKNNVNGLIRKYWPLYFDGLADVAANPNLGADGAYLSGTYFQDQTHPTTTGNTIYAAIVSNAVNSLDGFSLGADGASTATGTYTMLAKDVFLRCDTAAASTINAVSAVGYTGQIRTIINKGTFPCTLAAASGETIDSGTSIPVPAQSTVQIKGVLNSASAGGAHWETNGYQTGQVLPFNSTTFTGTGSSPSDTTLYSAGSTVIPAGKGIDFEIGFARAAGTGTVNLKLQTGSTVLATCTFSSGSIGPLGLMKIHVKNNAGVQNAQVNWIEPVLLNTSVICGASTNTTAVDFSTPQPITLVLQNTANTEQVTYKYLRATLAQ